MGRSWRLNLMEAFWPVLGIVVCGLLSGFATIAKAQGGQGENLVYNSSGTKVGSKAFIDASTFAGNVSSPNICSVLNYILTPTNNIVPSSGALIDARGLPGSTGTSWTCTNSPWYGISTPPPSTILLPAGTIVIPSTWILPSNTRLIGEGDGVPLSGAVGTTIQASTSTFSGPMLQFGSSTVCPGPTPSVCSGISVENLTLDGNTSSLATGILNQYSQSNTFVDHVGLYQILGTGLSVESGADGSGPYSNIRFDTAVAGLAATVCVNLNGLTSTRGIRGLSCMLQHNDGTAAIYLDSSNNLIQDVEISGFYDGVLIGANANAQSNVLVHIIGDTSRPLTTTPVNTVHISNSGGTVSDISLMGLSNSGYNGTYTVEDDVTGPHLSDTSVAIYAIGEAVNVGGTSLAYSRYTTSPNIATWAVGASTPTSGCTSATRGALYSCIGGSSSCCPSGSSCTVGTSAALWICGISSGSAQWIGVD